MRFRSILKPESSVMAALAVAGTVYAVYQLNIGSTATAHATEANHPALESSRKKAGYTSFILVSGLFLVTKDANVGSIGFGSIIAMEVIYRHSIMADPMTGRIQAPAETAYQPAENVIPLDVQAQPVAVGY
jgi:hypothetical protein